MYSFTQEAATHEENDIRKHGSTTFKADFKAFNLAISPRLEALLYSGEKLASITDSPLLPSQLSLQLATLSSQVTSTKGTQTCSKISTQISFLVIILAFTFNTFLVSQWQQLPALWWLPRIKRSRRPSEEVSN